MLIPILSYPSRRSVHSCKGMISGELKLVVTFQIFKELGLAQQQMQNIYNSLPVFPIFYWLNWSDGGPKVALVPQVLKMHHLAQHILLGALCRICCSRWIPTNLWDGIHPRIPKEVTDVVAKPLSMIFEWS